LYFITDFVNVRKEESKPPSPLNGRRKKKETESNFKSFTDSCLNLVCGVLKVEGICTTKGSTKLRMCENRVLVLPVNGVVRVCLDCQTILEQ